MKRRARQPVRPEPIGRTIPECFRICALACRTPCGRLCEQADLRLVTDPLHSFPAPHRAKLGRRKPEPA